MAEVCPKCLNNTLDRKIITNDYYEIFKCVMSNCNYQEKRKLPFERLPTEEKLNELYRKLIELEKEVKIKSD